MVFQIFVLHGTLSVTFIGILAGVNSGGKQAPEFYVAATALYAVIALLVLSMIFRLHSLVRIYSGEIGAVERDIRTTSRRRILWPTSWSMCWFVLIVSIIAAAYAIAPARDSYPLLKPLAPILKYFDVPIRIGANLLG